MPDKNPTESALAFVLRVCHYRAILLHVRLRNVANVGGENGEGTGREIHQHTQHHAECENGPG